MHLVCFNIEIVLEGSDSCINILHDMTQIYESKSAQLAMRESCWEFQKVTWLTVLRRELLYQNILLVCGWGDDNFLQIFAGKTEFEEAVAQWGNSSESWTEFKFFDFHEI